jgi:hypothetical protein
MALNLWALEGPTLEVSLAQLKTELEVELAGAREQKTVAALAVKFASVAWAKSAQTHFSADSPWRVEASLAALNREWADKNRSWTSRETASLKLYFEALTAICLALAQENKEAAWAFVELESLIKESQKSPSAKDNKIDQEAEARVTWSSRLAALTPILVRLKARDQTAALNEILDQLVQQAKSLAQRRDIHSQGRIELLCLNNAIAIAKSHFLLARSPASPLAQDAETLEAAWAEQIKGANNSVADQIALTWVTTAQLTFPLAYWLAGHPPAK